MKNKIIKLTLILMLLGSSSTVYGAGSDVPNLAVNANGIELPIDQQQPDVVYQYFSANPDLIKNYSFYEQQEIKGIMAKASAPHVPNSEEKTEVNTTEKSTANSIEKTEEKHVETLKDMEEEKGEAFPIERILQMSAYALICMVSIKMLADDYTRKGNKK
ncbi:hypothetical protein WP2_11 [Lactococcus phage WP-2]|uniref:Uncharacterized protein n=1 Tax=Lactococcus phage WP-2 TaxID=1486423 RepID=A0A024B474_9CAUD|nr:hypothetical protein WP2_11 [Lactococcus phage WP-2]AHZ10883.1 hypothetical protein WP2_11 [Lactococcus phage WP-2]